MSSRSDGGNANTSKKRTVDVIDIKRHGGSLLVPESLTYAKAAELLLAKEAAEEQTINTYATVAALPWEVALSFVEVVRAKFGLMETLTEWTWFGPKHPAAVEIEVGVNKTAYVPLNTPIAVPGIDGKITITGTFDDTGRLSGRIGGTLKRKDEPTFAEIVDEVRAHIDANNIYRGQVLKLTFDEGDNTPKLKFMDTSRWNVSMLRYNAELTEQIEDRIVGFIENPDNYQRAGVRPRRGVIAAGDYGTGKTVLGKALILAAQRANATLSAPWTTIWLENVRDLEKAMLFVGRWGRTILMAEDIDQIAATQQRDERMNALSMALDGLNSNSQTLIYVTTNNYTHIHPVLKRDGRFDVVLHMERPDAPTVEGLIRSYGGKYVARDADLTLAGIILAGITPAAIENVVAAAKESYLARTGSLDFQINGDDFARAARAIAKQHDLKQSVEKAPMSKEEMFGREIGRGVAAGVKEVLTQQTTQPKANHVEADAAQLALTAVSQA